MKTLKPLISLIGLCLITLMACQKIIERNEKTPEDQPQKANAVTMAAGESQDTEGKIYGIYRGVLPCADCEGIKTKITLLKNGAYKLSSEYLGKSEQHFYDSGKFESNGNNSAVTLTSKDGSSRQYQVGEDILYHLDNDGNRITGSLADNYKLEKMRTDPKLEDKTWELVELMGKPINAEDNPRKMFVMFMSENGTLTGSDGCNRFNGGYELLEGSRYKSGPFTATLMACDNMEMSQQFVKTVENSDTYIVTDSTLSITKARMAIMAKFKLKEE